MEIVHIFGKNLFAIKYTGETKDEFSRLFEMWQNPEYLEDFFETQKADLVGDFSGNMNVENAILETFEYSQEFERHLLELSRQSKHEQSIKLTQKMQDREHTNHELEKIESCREYLMSEGIVDTDGIIEEMES